MFHFYEKLVDSLPQSHRPSFSIFVPPGSLFLFTQDLYQHYFHAIEEISTDLIQLNQCLNFETARQYVESLSTSTTPQKCNITTITPNDNLVLKQNSNEARSNGPLTVARSLRVSLTIRHMLVK